jgi:flagellar hook-associated protein 2
MASSTSLAGQIQAAADDYGTTLTKPINALQDQRDLLSSKSTAFNAIRAKMSAMNLSAGVLSNASSSLKFSVYAVASTSTDVATATASTGESIGTHSLLVTQLAKNDMVMSSRVTNKDTTIAAAIGTTMKSFQISVNGVNTQIDLTLDGSETNQGVLTKIASAVNAKLTTAGVSASVVTDTTSTSKLVFASRTTGAANAIVLSDLNGGNVLDSIGLTSAVLTGRTGSTSTTAGYSYADSGKLDAMFNLDGIDMTRSSNTVTDALPGMSISLKATQLSSAVPVSLTVSLDSDTIKKNVNDFLVKYNDLITVIRAQTAVDTVAKTRQVLSEDTTYVQMRTSLRLMVMGTVSSTATGNPSSLSAIGITADANGQLSITDTTKFTDTLKNGSSAAISDLFNSSNGVAVQMKARMDNFVKLNGVLDGNDKGIKDRIAAIDKKIADYKARNATKVEAYKTSLAAAQTLLSQLSTQTSLASSYLAKVNAGTA